MADTPQKQGVKAASGLVKIRVYLDDGTVLEHPVTPAIVALSRKIDPSEDQLTALAEIFHQQLTHTRADTEHGKMAWDEFQWLVVGADYDRIDSEEFDDDVDALADPLADGQPPPK